MIALLTSLLLAQASPQTDVPKKDPPPSTQPAASTAAPQQPPSPPPVRVPPPPPKDQSTEGVKEMVIIGDRRPSDILDVPSGVTVVTSNDIAEAGATNIVDVLQKQTGFFASGTNRGAYDQILDIRGYNNGGGNGQRTLVLVDGRRTNSVTGETTDWGSIPIENIDRIEIVKGPLGALYGDGALAGVVNIITKQGSEGNVATGQGGNWGTYRVAGNVGGDLQDALYDVFASTEGTRGSRHHDLYAAHDATARIDLDLNDSLQGYLKAGHHNDRRQEPGSLTLAEIQTFGPRYAEPDQAGDTQLQEDYVDVGLTQAIPEFGVASLFLDHTHRVEDTFSEQFGTFESSDDSDITMLQFKHVLKPILGTIPTTFTTGVDLSYETADGDSGQPGTALNTSKYQRRLVGAFEHVEARPFPFLLFSGGIRFDRALLQLDRNVAPGGFGNSVDTLRSFNELSPMAGVTWKLLEELSAYASWGKTFKLPTSDELVGFLTDQPGLDAEKANTVETGLRFWEKPLGMASVSFYHMRVRNELFFDDSTFNEINLPRVTHEGVELEARMAPFAWMDVPLSLPRVEFFAMYTYTKVTINEAVSPSEDGKTYPVTPKNAANVGVTLKQSGALLTVSGRYAGERYLINDLDNAQPQLPAYWVYDFKLSYSWKRLTVFGAVYNFTNRRYIDNGGASLFGSPSRFEPGPERNWLLGAEVRF